MYMYDAFYSPPLSDSEFDSKPMVMLVGQYSTGKTSVRPRPPSLPSSLPPSFCTDPSLPPSLLFFYVVHPLLNRKGFPGAAYRT